MSSRQLVYTQKRRSTRIYNAVPLTIHGSDAFRAPYLEQVSTIAVNCHGCRYQSKHEVIQGDLVRLEVKEPSEGSTAYSCNARVKWVLRIMNKTPRFEIAVELVAPGNIWGIVSPPSDWLPNHVRKAIGQGNASQELPLATSVKEDVAPDLNEKSNSVAYLEREDLAATLSPAIGQVMSGFGRQIQTMISHAATAAFITERDRLIGEFRTQLQSEATKTLECVISTSKEELTRRVLQELNDAHEAAARSTCERWNKQIEQNIKNAEQHIVTQTEEVTRRVEGMRVSTIERLQRNMEASRTQAVERFLTRLREQVAPLLDGAQVTLQNLTASKNKLSDESRAIMEQVDTFLQQATQTSIAEVQEKTVGMLGQFESDVMNTLAESHDSLHQKSVEAIAETTLIVRELSHGCEETVRGQLRSLVLSAADNVAKVLQDRSVQISRQFSDQLERNTRSYLDLIGKSSGQVPKQEMIQTGD